MNASVLRKMRGLAAAVLLASTVGGVAAAGPARAAGTCSVQPVVYKWQSLDAFGQPNYVYDSKGKLRWTGKSTLGHAFGVIVTIVNGDSYLNPWTAAWASPGGTFPAGPGSTVIEASLTGLQVTEEATTWQISELPGGLALQPGGPAEFIWQGRVMQPDVLSNQIMTDFRLAGQPCSVL